VSFPINYVSRFAINLRFSSNVHFGFFIVFFHFSLNGIFLQWRVTIFWVSPIHVALFSRARSSGSRVPCIQGYFGVEQRTTVFVSKIYRCFSVALAAVDTPFCPTLLSPPGRTTTRALICRSPPVHSAIVILVGACIALLRAVNTVSRRLNPLLLERLSYGAYVFGQNGVCPSSCDGLSRGSRVLDARTLRRQFRVEARFFRRSGL